jgi:hypothetical protein
MREEYESLIKNGVWKLVDRPSNKNMVKCKWVYKVKRNASGDFAKFKARLVARGSSQKYGIDFDEPFSPIVRYSSLIALVAIANQMDLDMDHFDIGTAFLNGKLNEIIYMEQPPGYEVEGDKLCLLQTSINS